MSVGMDSLLVSDHKIRNGRLRIVGTGITVHRIVMWYKLGHTAEEISRRYGHISVAQVYAALAYYHANQAEIEADLTADEKEANRIEVEYTDHLQLS